MTTTTGSLQEQELVVVPEQQQIEYKVGGYHLRIT